MASVTSGFLLLFFVFPVFATEIPKGAHLLLRMENSINTRTAQEGDYVYLKTASPITADGHIIVPAGSYVQGIVSRAKQSGRVKGRAELSIHLETLTLPAGTSYRIAPRLASVESGDSAQKVDSRENDIKQGGTKGKDAETIAITAGTGAAIGGLADRSWKGAGIGAGIGTGVGLARVLLSRGKEVELSQGSTLDVVFDRPVTLE
jgi:type IV secretion system protein VirB10